jgi:hypothetical protein
MDFVSINSGLPFFASLKTSSQQLGVPKPFQQNAAHFFGFFNAQAFTSKLATLSH